MRKQELIQLHALTVLVRQHSEKHYEFSPGTFQAYEDCSVSPASIHRRKADHKEALFLLLDGLEAISEVVPQQSEHVRSSVD